MAEHKFAGKKVLLRDGREFRVEDWADNVWRRSVWMMNGNPTALKYAVHVAEAGLPIDDRAVYGKIGIFAEVVHDSEIIGVRDKEDVDEYRIIDDSISDEELKEILKRTWQK